ncbi:MAG: arginine--tRNA ligase [Parvibaculales bacterium]
MNTDIYTYIWQHVAELFKEIKLGEQFVPPKSSVQPPHNPKHGDISITSAMLAAKQFRCNPLDIAEKIKKGMESRIVEHIEQIEIVAPGFVNLRLKENTWASFISYINNTDGDYGKTSLKSGKKVNIEYVSANPTGPMHIGHARGAVFGDALANLMETVGYEVTREYYINDAGAQIDILARSALLRYQEALGQKIKIGEGLYPGEYLKPVGEKLQEDYGATLSKKPEQEQIGIARNTAVEAMMELIREDLEALGVKHAIFVSEEKLHEEKKIEKAIQHLTEKGLVYKGIIEPPKGKEPPPDWEAEEQTLFRSSKFGDDTDRVLLKADGTPTYFAADIAYHFDKFQRGFTDMINVWGADHSGYVKRIKSAIEAISGGEAELDVKICQLVKLMRDGKPVKMSKRSGEFITLRNLVDEVGKNAVRFTMLTRKNEAPLEFDFTKAVEKSRDNPVYYVQYAHARICSVLRNADDFLYSGTEQYELLTDSAELSLIKTMCQYPRMVEMAATSHEPHRIAFYLNDLASDFHALWNKGKDEPKLRFLQKDNPATTFVRLEMIKACQIVIRNALAILGVEAEEEM